MIGGRIFQIFCIFLSVDLVLTNFSDFFMQNYTQLHPWFAWLCVLCDGKIKEQVAKICETNVAI